MNKLAGYVRLLRPLHWSKNIFVFAALIFASQKYLFDVKKIAESFEAFICFSLISSFAYVINDIHDIDFDRQHPKKKDRPLAAGVISIRSAWVVAGILLVLGFVSGFSVNVLLGLVAVAYLVLNILYSWYLKDHVIVDVMCIAIGFVLRALAGVVAIEVPLSPWLMVCTFTLCLFVGFGKRRCEIAVTNNNYVLAVDRRPVLVKYTLEALTHLLTISAALAITTFLLYTMDPQTASKFGTNYLIYSSPLVIYGVFRFAVLIQTGKFGGPMELFAADRPFQVTIALWIIMVAIIVHQGPKISALFHRLNGLY
ncbi:MAG: decaprenyl-phosphate phosphoribosyltransferase [Phycisphaerae bacterium]